MITEEWLRNQELRSAGAAEVRLTGDDWRELLANIRKLLSRFEVEENK